MSFEIYDLFKTCHPVHIYIFRKNYDPLLSRVLNFFLKSPVTTGKMPVFQRLKHVCLYDSFMLLAIGKYGRRPTFPSLFHSSRDSQREFSTYFNFLSISTYFSILKTTGIRMLCDSGEKTAPRVLRFQKNLRQLNCKAQGFSIYGEEMHENKYRFTLLKENKDILLIRRIGVTRERERKNVK